MGISWTELQPLGDIDEWWDTFAIDYDGSNLMLLASESTGRSISTDSGSSWTESEFLLDYYNMSNSDMSSDGSIVLIADNDILLSTDSGSSWSASSTDPAIGVAMSDDGTILYAINHTNILKSTNSGDTWTSIVTFSGNHYEQDIACSSDGSYVFYADRSYGLYVSSNYGSSWTKITITGCDNSSYERWVSVACSDNGEIVLAANEYCGGYISKDYGVTWNRISLPVENIDYWSWGSCDVSSDGQVLVIMGDYSEDDIYVSRDCDETWTEEFPPTWESNGDEIRNLAISGDGTKLLFGYYGGRAYIGDYAGKLPTYIKTIGKFYLRDIKTVNGVTIANLKSIAKVSNLGDL